MKNLRPRGVHREAETVILFSGGRKMVMLRPPTKYRTSNSFGMRVNPLCVKNQRDNLGPLRLLGKVWRCGFSFFPLLS